MGKELKIGDVAGMRSFKFSVPMVYKSNKKFASFLQSCVVDKPLYVTKIKITRNILNINSEKVEEVEIKKENKIEDKKEAMKLCMDSLNKKIRALTRGGYLPVMTGGEPLTRNRFDYWFRKNPNLEWTDKVCVLNSTTTVLDD